MSSAHHKISLRALQVFEAAARHQNFTDAARELRISQSGVSRHISDLEANLGTALFTRQGARLSVTQTGDRLGRRLGENLSDIWTAVGEAGRSENVVTLSMLPSLATRWFAPRLGAFIAEHPDIDLRITASRHLVDFSSEGVDAALRYSVQPSAELDAQRLATERVTPVCAPSYRDQQRLVSPRDLARCTLLHGDIPENWGAWYRAAQIDGTPKHGPKLGDDGAILQAAIDGQGVALGRSHLVAADLSAGRLVAPFDIHLEASHAYWFVTPKGHSSTEQLTRVRAWFDREFNPSQSLPV